MNAAVEVLTDHEHTLAGRAGVEVRTDAQASAVKSLIAAVRAEEAAKQLDLTTSLQLAIETIEAHQAFWSLSDLDSMKATLAKAGAQ